MASPGRFHSSGNCFQPITGFLLTFINWALFFFLFFLAIVAASASRAGRVSLIPAQEEQLLGWELHRARAGGELLLPMEASPASSHSPSPWGGSSGLVEAGSGATGGHTHGKFPNIDHCYTRNKTCGKTTLVLGWGPHLPAPPSHPCALHQLGATTGPTETAPSPGATKAGQIGHEPEELCPHSCAPSLWDKQKKKHSPSTSQSHRSTQERRGWALTTSWLRAALERSHFPFAAQITCCSTSGAAAQGLPAPNTPPLAPAGTSRLVPAWIAPRADKKLQLMLLAGGKGAPAVPNNPAGEGMCQQAAGLL